VYYFLKKAIDLGGYLNACWMRTEVNAVAKKRLRGTCERFQAMHAFWAGAILPSMVPIPYANTGSASDTSQGPTSVKTDGQMPMVKDALYSRILQNPEGFRAKAPRVKP
jgi:hypothetical protein